MCRDFLSQPVSTKSHEISQRSVLTCLSWETTASRRSCLLPVMVTMAPLLLIAMAVAFPIPAEPPAHTVYFRGECPALMGVLKIGHARLSVQAFQGIDVVEQTGTLVCHGPVMRTFFPSRLL